MEERDELEIETRLRAALQARSELVTHSTLRPGIPPNQHTAGVRSGRAGAWWTWRRSWVPVTVAAALAGGVFVGAQLPSGGTDKSAASAGGSPDRGASIDASSSGPASGQVSKGETTPAQGAPAPGTVTNLGTVSLTVSDGWQLTQIGDSSGCVTVKTHPAPAPAADGAAALPCGVDALYVKTDATPGSWPLNTATKATGWWPEDVTSASDITCPAAKPSATGTVKDSIALRSSANYALDAKTTAEYHEWAVACDNGSGVRAMLWKLNAAAGAAAPAKFTVATVVSADPAYDGALLDMVGSLHQAS